jgi:hypothetical protein
MLKSFIQKLKVFLVYLKNSKAKDVYKPLYKLTEILEDQEEYVVVIQLIGKNIVFNAKPEEILADDSLVDRFSPRDIRTLTYLGYLGINGPKYKILAKKLSQHENATFLIKKKGEKKIIVRTAEQILNETSIIQHLNAEDAKTVGYTAASESVISEKKQKEALLAELKK